MALYILLLLFVFFLVGLAAFFISTRLYRHLVRTGYAYPIVIRVVSFILSFALILFIAAWIFFSLFRFER